MKYKEREFWLTIVVMICATVLAFTGKIDDSQWMQVEALSAGAFSVSRGLAKRSA